MTEYGKRLRLARAYAKLTQNDLSKKTGIGQSTISTAEREGAGSKETPTYAQACGVDVFWLANGTGSMVPEPGALAAQPVKAGDLIDSLAVLLAGADETKRDSVAALLASLARDPTDEQTRGAIKLMLSGKAFAQHVKIQA